MEPGPWSEESWQAVRLRRAELRESMGAVETALARPVPSRADAWAERVQVALVELSADLRLHVALTEAADGLHAEIVQADPRLAHATQGLSDDHVAVRALLDDVLALVARVPVDPVRVRDLATDLLGRLVRHRQRGSDLAYEALQVDLGGED